MARIPEEEVEKIKAEIELVRVVEAAGIELKPHGYPGSASSKGNSSKQNRSTE